MPRGTSSIAEIRKKVTKTYEFISTSYHEAGHTIYALLNFMKVSSVSVYEDKKLKRIHGITYYDYPPNLDKIENSELLNSAVRAEIGLCYSGLIAEKALFKSISGATQTPMFISDSSADDNEEASDFIKKYNLAPPGRKRSLYKQKLMREVRNKLYSHWDAVTVIAHALFKHRRLSYDDIQTLLTKKSRNKKFWKDQFKKINNFCDKNKQLDEKELKLILSS